MPGLALKSSVGGIRSSVEPPPPFTDPRFARADSRHFGHKSSFAKTVEAWRMLHSFAQTCRYLRAFALPSLWSVCHIRSVQQLRCIREALRASPHLARRIRSFSLAWRPPDMELLREYTRKNMARSLTWPSSIIGSYGITWLCSTIVYCVLATTTRSASSYTAKCI